MTTSEQLLNRFIDEWTAGRRPRVREYLARLPDGPARDELAERIDSWLQIAPTPAYDDAARQAIRSHPAVGPLLEHGAARGAWTTIVPRLRRRAALSSTDVAAALIERLDLGADNTPRAAAYLDQLETGRLDPSRVSRRLLDALGALLGVSSAWLAELASPRHPGAPAPAALLRSDGDAAGSLRDDLELLSRAALTPAMDELDRLFTGGRDA